MYHHIKNTDVQRSCRKRKMKRKKKMGVWEQPVLGNLWEVPVEGSHRGKR
jgi:hypothetical protein